MKVMPAKGDSNSPQFNWKKLLKRDYIWLATHRCKRHNRLYIEHPHCYFVDKPQDGPIDERVGFFDIEASNLHADFGFIISYAFKELNRDVFGRVLKPKEIRQGIFDKHLTEQLCEDIRKFTRVIVYWGKNYRFDIPYVRTRAVKWGCDFPKQKELIVNDLYDTVRSKLRLHRNRLQTACDEFDIPSKGHRLDPKKWQMAQAGNKEALDWIYEHNKEDVISTELLWKRLVDYSSHPNTSI